MIVGIDYTAAAWQGAGIGRYTRELVHALVAADPSVRYVLFYAAGGLPPNSPYVRDVRHLAAAHPNVRVRPLPLSPRLLTILWQRVRLPLRAEWLAGPLDVLHAPDFVLPPTRARTLLTIHDLTFLVQPQCFEPALQRYLARVVPQMVRRADCVLVDSHASQADLLRLLGPPAARVQVVYPGVSARFRPLPPAETEPVRQRLGLPPAFLLFVGTLEPRKNLVGLLDALARLPDAPPLVIAGRKGWLYEDIFAALERHGLHERVHFLDFVADEDLPAVYNLSTVFVYPSRYEGFGLPVAEALACGVPVVTSDVASLPEVAGTAAVLVPPTDPAALAAGIVQAQHQAHTLRQRGPPQAARFGWQAAAQQVLACYRAVMHGGNG